MKLGQKKLFVALSCLLSLVWLVGSAFATNLVVNGGFEDGNVNFTSQYGFVPVASQFPAPGTLGPEGLYGIGSDPNAYHTSWPGPPPFTTDFGPQGGTRMMIVNGAPAPHVIVWSQTVAITSNTDYYFSAYVATTYNTNPAVLDFSINGSTIGQLTANPMNGIWDLFYVPWNSGNHSSAVIALVNQNTIRDGNDFCLDNIQMDTTNPVPLPSTVLLLGSGLVGLGLLRGRKWSLKK